ncbi:MAG: thiol:disulfide interchange protein, partial [Microcystis panniformis]
TLPYATTTGETSDFNILVGASQTDPRSHGSQVNQ